MKLLLHITLQCYSFRNETKEDEETSRWNQFLVKALTTSPIDSRAFRAGVIYNPLRGLTLNEMNNNLKDVNNKEGMIMRKNQYHFHEFYFPQLFLNFRYGFPRFQGIYQNPHKKDLSCGFRTEF